MCDLPACWSQVFPVISSVIHVMLVTYHALFKSTEKLLWKRLTCFISGQDCSTASVLQGLLPGDKLPFSLLSSTL